MVRIPWQLTDPEMRFCLLKKGDKIPVETQYNVKGGNNYSFDDPKLKKHIENGGNYGVVLGIGNVVVVDCDSEKSVKKAEEMLPKTFTIKTTKGKHFYYFVDDLNRYTNARMDLEVGTTDEHMGELMIQGCQVVAPGSIHPSGKKYEVEKDREIVKIEGGITLIKSMFLEKPQKKTKENEEYESIFEEEYKIEDYINGFIAKKESSIRMFGVHPHPNHGSKNGMNFSINKDLNAWYCYRDHCGGGLLQWIAIQEDIITCKEYGIRANDPSRQGSILTSEEYAKTFEIAKKKYKLKIKDSNKLSSSMLPEGIDGKLNHNDIAELLINKYCIKTPQGDKIIYIYMEDTGLYTKEGEEFLEAKVQEIAGKKTKQHLVNEVLWSIKRQTRVKRKNLEVDSNYIPLSNGIFNLNDGTLQEYNSDFFFLDKHPIIYDPNQKSSPIINKFLSQVVEEKDVLLLKELVGYCFYRKYCFQKVFVLFGKGGNGKGVFLNILGNMIGDELVTSQSLQALTSDKFSAAELYQKNANIFGDLPSGKIKDSAKIKECVSGTDMVNAQKKYGSAFSFVNYAKFVISCNQIPETNDQSDGFYRRFLIINFPNFFATDDTYEDRDLCSRLTKEKELSGFFFECIEAFKNVLKRNSFCKTMKIEEIKKLYMQYSNSTEAFLIDETDFDPDYYVLCDDLYEKYSEYCTERKLVKYNERVFFKIMYKFYNNKLHKRRQNTPIVWDDSKSPIRTYVIWGIVFKKRDDLNHYGL